MLLSELLDIIDHITGDDALVEIADYDCNLNPCGSHSATQVTIQYESTEKVGELNVKVILE